MGCFPTRPKAVDPAAQRASDEIDSAIKKEKIVLKHSKPIRMLLLGAGESGKSTFLKQLRLKYGSDFSDRERKDYTPIIWSNIIQSIQAVIEAFEFLEIDAPNDLGDQSRMDKLAGLSGRIQDCESFSTDVADDIAALWSRTGTKEAVTQSHLYQLNDSAEYYFNEIKRIGSRNYIPTVEDILRSRVITTGVSETRYTVGNVDWIVVDVGGQRSERKKWIHCFEGIDALLFFIAISEYDQVLYEDETANRLSEAAILFESIANSPWFYHTQIILFLNKTDIFRSKIKRSPLSGRFPHYQGDGSFQSGCRFMRDEMMKLVQNRHQAVSCHFTCATDRRQTSLVLDKVKELVLKKSLSAVGIL